MFMIVPNWLHQRAFLTPHRIALYEGEKEITFSELHELAKKKAKQLLRLGVKKGDIVAVHMKNSAKMVEIIHALQYVGAIALLQNIRLTREELIWQLRDSQASFVICDHAQSLQPMDNDIQLIEWAELETVPEQEGMLQTTYNLDDVATIMYTSGTTGKPKGVMQTYGNHWWSAIGSALNLGLHMDDCWLAAVPFFHVSGFSILMRSVIYGMSVYILPQFDAKKANEIILQQKATIMSVVSTMLQQMLRELNEPYPSTFRCMLLGGGPAPRALLDECARRHIPVYQTYGMTETASQVVTLPPEYLSKRGSAGKPLFPVQIRIEKDGKEAKANEAGEIVVKGPNVMKGYLYREEETKKVLKDGWFYTGDIGYVDEDGFLYVLDRRSDLIISGGENVYPAEVESVLLEHKAVKEAGVIGIDDGKWGQVPCAFVVVHEDEVVTEEELQQFCEQKLAKYKVPKQFYFVNNLPRNASNKLLRRELLSLLTGEGRSDER
ncbi:o-succinylbenzoate--CoA ligase [Thermolongibacillus altinsuensis]|uniref:o-succinylbenzoate--CoA ligase n=1 Tax=Thermolongibacillus altinsuensis TaxID=575256 RepID=UPI0025550A57|nr:o-succinylbenzoate--CoA ligase [Thermolongibacillus altinsuensis]